MNTDTAISQINRTTSCERIAHIVADELGSNLISDLDNARLFTYSEIAASNLVDSYQRSVCLAAATRVATI